MLKSQRRQASSNLLVAQLHRQLQHIKMLSMSQSNHQRIALSVKRLLTSGGAGQPKESRRKAFQRIKPNSQVLHHLDELGLGYVAKQKTRNAISSKFDNVFPGVKPASKNSPRLKNKNSRYFDSSPYPFNKGPRKVQKILTAKEWKEIPDFGDVPEVAIIGRSNVGKSTLLNSLLGYNPSHVQKAVVSNKPGETRALQFFTLGKHITTKQPTFVITDMPGYGFAFMKPSEAKRCFMLSSRYLRSRGKKLKRVLLLIDARHGFKQTDIKCFQNLVSMNYDGPVDMEIPDEQRDLLHEQAEVTMDWKLQIVLTKCDLVERLDLARRIQIMRDELSTTFPYKFTNMPILMLSAAENRGVVELHKELASLVPPSASGAAI